MKPRTGPALLWFGVAAILAWVIRGCPAHTQAEEERWESRWLRVKVTAYCAGPCDKCGTNGDRTSSGRDARKDGVATDPEVIPTGSRVDIPGIDLGPNGNGSWLLADDTGSRVRGAIVDVRIQGSDHEENKRWGAKKKRVRVWTRVR